MLTTPLIHVICYPKARTCLQKLTTLASAHQELSLGAATFKMGHLTLTTPCLRAICFPYAGT